MSTLKELLKDVPVEWKSLEEISDLYNGLTGKNKSDFEDGNAKFVTYKNIYGNIEVNPNTLESVKISPEERQNEVKYGDILFTGSSENTSDVGASCAVTFKPDFKLYLNSFSFGLRFKSNFKLIPQFTKYLFRSYLIREQIIKTASGVTRYNVSKKRFLKIQIPIPYPNDREKSLEIQQEIVRVLDGLSEQNKALTTALAQEIDQRKKQYEYYREELFRFEGKEVEWKTLGSECDILTGGEAPTNCIKGPTPNGENIYPVYGNGVEIYGFTNTYRVDRDAVTISSIGANTGSIFFRSAFFTPIIRLKVVLPKLENLKPKFLYHYLSTVTIASKSSSIPNMNASDVKKIKVPLVTIEEQERIVRLLDQFDEATKNIVAQLEKEIELRNKQYEYYRNQLLSFDCLN